MNFQPVYHDSDTISVFQEQEKGHFFLLLLNILRSFKLKSSQSVCVKTEECNRTLSLFPCYLHPEVT